MSSLSEYVEKLECPDELERTYAAEDIGYLNAPEGVQALLSQLGKESSALVRDAIFQSLIRVDADEAIQGSITLLQSDDPQIRNQAVDVLRRKGDRAIPFLNTVMQSDDKDLRKLVLDILNGVHARGAEAIYDAALRDQDTNVVITAVECLGRVRAEGFRSRIEALLQADANPMLVGVCLEALSAIGNELSLVSIRSLFPELTKLPDFILVSCLKAFGALGGTEEFVEVADLLAARPAHLAPRLWARLSLSISATPGIVIGEHLLPTLRSIVEDGDRQICRYQAVRALGSLSMRDDVYSFLVLCLSSPERMVRLGAIESLRSRQRPGLDAVLASRALEETDEEVLQALNC